MRWFLFIFLGLIIFMVSYVGLSHTYKPSFEQTDTYTYNEDVWKQLAYIKERIENGGAEAMQAYYPEGFFFTLSLYALAHIEMLTEFPSDSEHFKHSKLEIEKAIELLKSDKGKAIFHDDLPLPYGAYYNGWLHFVKAKYLEVLPDSLQSTTALNELKHFNAQLRSCLHNSKTPYLESYPGMCWPADMTACMAAYSIGNKLNNIKNDTLIDWWIPKTNELLDSFNLIPHRVNSIDGTVAESSLGSSQSLLLFFMHEIDSVQGAAFFAIYKSNFLIHRFGLPAISEYPRAEKGNHHIDSGPVIWKVGAAASIVGIRSFYLYGDKKTARKIRNSVNSFAFAKSKKDQRKYMFGKWLMADAFIAWVNAIESSPKKVM